MRAVVGAVGDGAHGGKGQAVVGADLGNGRALHFHGQHGVAGLRQFGVDALRGAGRHDELVATGNAPAVQLGAVAAQQGQWPVLRRLHAAAGGLFQRGGQGRVAAKVGLGVAGHQPARKQRAHVHVVLHKLLRHDHIAHAHARRHAPGHAGEQQALDAAMRDQRGGGGGGGHLADAAQGQHHVLPVQAPAREGAPGKAFGAGVLQQVLQAVLLFGQGADDGKGHAKNLQKHAPLGLGIGRWQFAQRWAAIVAPSIR